MNKKERLTEYFHSKHYIPLKFDELVVMLDVPQEERTVFLDVLKELESEGHIFLTKKGRYMPCTGENRRFSGVLRCNASGKFGFLIRDGEDDIYIPCSAMGNALHGDKVLVKLTGSRNGKPEGAVVKVLERSKEPVVGVVFTKHGKLLRVKPDDKRIFAEIYVRPAGAAGAAVGQRVVVSGLNFSPDGHVFGRIDAILGESGDLSSYMESIILVNKIKTEFDSDTLDEAAGISDEISWNHEEREDFRGLTVFTIDGELARDFDDAVSIERLDNGNYYLGVHIADVSEYVREGSALDREAFERGTSVYLPDRVIPMLPEKLSNGVCSLNPKVDRLTLSVFMEIDTSGKILSNKLAKSVIKSSERLTYTDMNRLFEDKDAEIEKRYAHILPELNDMLALSEILRKKRFERGAIDFDFPEAEILTDENGEPVEIRTAERGASNRLIEEFMLAANETVAEFAYWAELPFVYRVHEAPSPEKLSAFQLFLKPFGLSVKGKIDAENPVKPKAFEQIIDKVRGTAVEGIVSRTMLRSLMKAEYRAENDGHFGLAAKYYCHFTSPIRRYPDLVVHRSLKRLLDGRPSLDISYMRAAARQSSERETAAEYCERDADDLMKAAYMQKFIGMEADAVVSGVSDFGMFAELENGIEGMIRLENMTDDYYVYNDTAQTLTGERTGKQYKIGDFVSVMVVRSDLMSRKIDFVLSEDVSHDILAKFEETHKKRRRRKK